MAKSKLNQIIAVTAGKKADAHKVKTEVHHLFQKQGLLDGINRTYQPKTEDGDKLPSESKHIQVKVADGLSKVRNSLTDLFDVVASQDWGNTVAKADVVVDGVAVVLQAPVTYLLFLEKQLVDLHTFVEKLPVLDSAKLWEYDPSTDAYATKPVQTVKTKKVPKNHEKAPATDKHPAQVEVYHEDVVTGYWTTVEHSGAIPAKNRNEMLDRVRKLQDAVKSAREEANTTPVDNQKVGRAVFDYLLGK